MGSFDGHRDVEVPFAEGAIYGIRAYGVVTSLNQDLYRTIRMYGHSLHPEEAYPLLVGPARTDFDYHDGLNYALCNRSNGVHCPHVASRRCSCGFYSYTAPVYNNYMVPGNLGAVIKAYGLVTYGSQGFRSEKCEIVAAVNPYLANPDGPKDTSLPHYYLPARLRSRQPPAKSRRESTQMMSWRNRPMLVMMGILETFFALFSLWRGGGAQWGAIVPGLIALACTWFFLESVKGGILIRDHRQRCDNSERWDQLDAMRKMNAASPDSIHPSAADHYNETALEKVVFDELAQKYPSIEWFPDIASMLMAYPLTQYEDLPHPKRKITYDHLEPNGYE